MDHILKCHDIAKTDFERAENCYFYDRSGKCYVDFESGIWCTALGHSHPRINQVMCAQIKKVIHLGTRYPNNLSEDAAIALLEIAGIENGKCVFLSSGSEAVEFGSQIARLATKKQRLLTFSTSYLAAYGSAGKKRPDEWEVIDSALWDSPDADECLKNIPFEQIGAFVFEPGGSGYGFVKFPPKSFVQAIARRVKHEGGLIVANEITTGMGRTGKWFGFQHYEIQPDIVAVGKCLGNGYPVSAVAMTQPIAEKLETDGFRYAQSHQNDPLGCAVAKEVIAILREEHWIERGNLLGGRFLDGLNRIATQHEIVKEARGRGMLLGLELFPHERLSAQRMYEMLLESGFLVGYYPAGNMLRFDPALTIEEDDVTRLLECLNDRLNTV